MKQIKYHVRYTYASEDNEDYEDYIISRHYSFACALKAYKKEQKRCLSICSHNIRLEKLFKDGSFKTLALK